MRVGAGYFPCMAFSFRLPRFPRFPRIPFPRPALTAAEKTAVLAVTLVLSTGGLLRVWEHAGVSLGPVDDWESLRALVIRSRERLHADGGAEGGGGYPCLDDAPVMRAGGTGGGGASGMATLLAGGATDGREAGKTKSASGKRGGGKQPPARPLDLNTAGERALVALPGVGPSTAKAIVAYRAAHGPFKNIEDLMQVKGIGPKKFETLRPHVKVEGRVKAEGEPKRDARASPEDHDAARTSDAGQAPPSQMPQMPQTPQARPAPALSP